MNDYRDNSLDYKPQKTQEEEEYYYEYEEYESEAPYKLSPVNSAEPS